MLDLGSPRQTRLLEWVSGAVCGPWHGLLAQMLMLMLSPIKVYSQSEMHRTCWTTCSWWAQLREKERESDREQVRKSQLCTCSARVEKWRQPCHAMLGWGGGALWLAVSPWWSEPLVWCVIDANVGCLIAECFYCCWCCCCCWKIALKLSRQMSRLAQGFSI